MTEAIEVREVEPQLLAVVRDTATPATITKKILGSPVWAYMRANGIKSGGHNVVVYFEIGRRGEFGVEIGADVLAPFPDGDPVVCSATPAGRVATMTHRGPYDRLGETHDALRRWVATNQQPFTGTSWEVYGHWTDNPADLATDIFYLLESR